MTDTEGLTQEGELERTPSGQFPKGVSGNPMGRPKGSKNKVTLMKLMAEEAVRTGSTDDMIEVAKLVIQQALNGDEKSQKLVWDAVMSKSSSDDKTQASEKVTIQIGGLSPQPVEVKGETYDNGDDANEE